MKLCDILRRMLAMCPLSWYIFIRCIQLSSVLLLGAVMMLIAWDGNMLENYKLYMTAITLNETAQTVLLVAVLLPVILEDLQSS